MSYHLLPIFVASLLGSPHCAAMCGGFVIAVTGGSGKLGVAGYHLGRLLTYLLMGALAAAAGAALERSSAWLGVAHGAAIVVGLVLIFLGISSFSPRGGVATGHGRLARGLTRLYRAVAGLARRSERMSPFLLGVSSALLPCGWLYISLAAAIATPEPVLAMAAFWAGTLPVLLAWGGVSTFLVQRLGVYFPRIRACALVLAGVVSLVSHVPLPSTGSTEAHTCHHGN